MKVAPAPVAGDGDAPALRAALADPLAPDCDRPFAPALLNSLPRVPDDVEEDLRQPVLVGHDADAPTRLETRGDFERRRFALGTLKRATEKLVDVRLAQSPAILPREGEKVFDYVLRAADFVDDHFEVGARLRVEPALPQKTFGVEQRGRQRVVQLVRHARGELPDRREFFGAEQLRRKPSALRDVLED